MQRHLTEDCEVDVVQVLCCELYLGFGGPLRGLESFSGLTRNLKYESQ